MLPIAKLVAYFLVALSIDLARYVPSAYATDINSANKPSVSSSDPVQHDTKQSLQTADTAETETNEERMPNTARSQRASAMSHLLDVSGLRREPLVSHPHDMYGPADAHMVSPTDQAIARGDIQDAASTSNLRKRKYTEQPQQPEEKNIEAKLLKEMKALIPFKVPYIPKKKSKARSEADKRVAAILKLHKSKVSSIVIECWRNDLQLESFHDTLVRNELSIPFHSKYEVFKKVQGKKMRKHFDEWLADSIPPENIVDKINAVIPEAGNGAVVLTYKNKYSTLYNDLQRFKPFLDACLAQKKTPEEVIDLMSDARTEEAHTYPKKRLDSIISVYTKWLRESFERVQKSLVGCSPQDARTKLGLGQLESPELFEHPNYQHYERFLQSWYVTHPMEDWQKWELEGKSPKDVRSMLGLAELESPELSQHPNFSKYIEFFKLWHEAHMITKLNVWMHQELPPSEVFARLAVRDLDDAELIPDKSDLYYLLYEEEWKKRYLASGTPVVST